jgi:MFS family permease
MFPSELPNNRSHVTLVLSTMLHLFTHAYGVVLVPLYLLMVTDLHLHGVKEATLVVTVYGVMYNLVGFTAGKMADRHDRRVLLSVGLLGNSIAIILTGMTHQYWMVMLLSVIAGLFGSLFHPAANALVSAHYPKSPGMAIGLLGIGSGLGFYIGPRFAGWRAELPPPSYLHIAAWQRPLVELGAMGVVAALLYFLFAQEATGVRKTQRRAVAIGADLRRKMFLISATLGCRDLAGVAAVSLIGIFLPQAHHMDAKETGRFVGLMMLGSIIVNPLLVYLSPRGRRLPMLVLLLITSGLSLMVIPKISLAYTLGALALFEALHLACYAVGDAAVLERLPDELRGRMTGMFFALAGTVASLGPWIVGYFTDRLGARGTDPNAYLPLFIANGLLLVIATSAVPIIARLGVIQGEPIDPLTETMPLTVETLG